jgi:beta-phosphoglucomutase
MEYAILFDVDGVLVDSYDAHFQSWQKLADQRGVRFSEADFARTFGQTSREILANDWPEELSNPQIAEMDDRKEQMYREIIRAQFKEIPGARDLAAALLDGGFALAVASSGPRGNIEAALDGLGHPEWFSAVASGQEVECGKPDPAVFLLAAQRLGADPGRCCVIEDAPAGVQAGKRAGCAVAALTGTAEGQALAGAGADLVVSSLTELTPAMLRQLIDANAAQRA